MCLAVLRKKESFILCRLAPEQGSRGNTAGGKPVAHVFSARTHACSWRSSTPRLLHFSSAFSFAFAPGFPLYGRKGWQWGDRGWCIAPLSRACQLLFLQSLQSRGISHTAYQGDSAGMSSTSFNSGTSTRGPFHPVLYQRQNCCSDCERRHSRIASDGALETIYCCHTF